MAAVVRASAAGLVLLYNATACGEPPPADRLGEAGGEWSGSRFVRVIDTAGRTVTLRGPARRIISLIPATTAFVIALGAGDRIVARTDYDEQAFLADLPSVGGGLTPSLEMITAARPDLVVAWNDGGSRRVITRLDDLGVAVYATRLESVDDIARTVRDLGTLLGRRRAADSIIAAIRSGLAAVREAVAGRPRPSVMYLLPGEPPVTAASGSYVHELIRIAGGRNAFADLNGWPRIGIEEVLERQPDVLVIPVGEISGPRPLERLRRAPGWRDLDAIRMGRVYSVSARLFNRPGPRVAETARRLAALLHPAAFPASEGKTR